MNPHGGRGVWGGGELLVALCRVCPLKGKGLKTERRGESEQRESAGESDNENPLSVQTAGD